MIGPALPPHLHKKTADAQEEADTPKSEQLVEEDYGPALPPHLAAKRATVRVVDTPPERVAQTTPDDDDDDDEIGPQLPSYAVEHDPDDGIREFLEREQRRKELAEVRLGPSRPCILLNVPIFRKQKDQNLCREKSGCSPHLQPLKHFDRLIPLGSNLDNFRALRDAKRCLKIRLFGPRPPLSAKHAWQKN